MNELKKRTNKNYTAWDLNCPQVVIVRNRQTLEKKFKRAAKHQMRIELKKGW